MMDENNPQSAKIPEKKKKRKLFDWKKKNVQLIIAAVLGVLVLIIYLSTFNFGDAQKSKGQSSGTINENHLTEVLSKIAGAGKISLAITYGDGGKTVYKEDTVIVTETTYVNGKPVETTTEKKTTVLVGGKPLIESVESPTILGVIIVASGASDPAVRLELIRATETLLGITTDVIKVFSAA